MQSVRDSDHAFRLRPQAAATYAYDSEHVITNENLLSSFCGVLRNRLHMYIRNLAVGVALFLGLLVGCAKKEPEPVVAPVSEVKPVTPIIVKPPEAVVVVPVAPKPLALEVVKETERSQHFLTVSRQLELGGTLYGYVDIDGDALKLATTLQNVLAEVAKSQPQASPFLKQDLPVLFQILGLTDIKALGLSSVPDGSGYFRNRVFFYTPDARHGLLAGLGGEPAPFARLNLAPANTDLYCESEVDLPAVYKTINEVVLKVGGEATANKMEQALKQAGQEVAISLLSVLQDWKGHTAMVMRIDENKSIRLPGPNGVVLPAFSLLLTVDGIAPALRDALLKLPVFRRRQEGALELFELKEPIPVAGLSPVIALEGSTLLMATSLEFLTECLQNKEGLAQTGDFKKALAPFEPKANGLSYISPRFFTKLQEIETLNPDMPADSKRVLQMVLSNIPKPDRPLVTVRTNLPDGILIQSYWNRSLKQDMAALALYNPATVGLIAAMAIPAFQKVRTSSQEKAVLNNLRQLAAAADQYYLENGKSTADYDDLVGVDKFIAQIKAVAGEDYRQLEFIQNQPLRVRLSSGQEIQYPND